MRRLEMRMGDIPDGSYIELEARVEVLPEEAKYKLPDLRWLVPGYDLKFFNYVFAPVRELKVKAGTNGTISFFLDVTYSYWYMDTSAYRKSPPEEKKGTVACGCSWDYVCTKQGELSLSVYDPEDSETSDLFSVTVGRVDRAVTKPPSGPPYVKMVSKSNYAGETSGPVTVPVPGKIPLPDFPIPGSGKNIPKSSVLNPNLIAYLAVTDAVVPPPPQKPPPPPARYPVPLVTIIPFGKEGQRDLDGAARKIASDWVQGMFALYPELRAPMMHGDVPVYFVGYASKTGPKGERDERRIDDYDMQIGSDRAANVIKYLKPVHLGSKADVSYLSIGRQQAQWASVFDEKLKKAVEVVGKPRDIDRVVVVWVDYESVKTVLNRK
jgi:hypothetical protein